MKKQNRRPLTEAQLANAARNIRGNVDQLLASNALTRKAWQSYREELSARARFVSFVRSSTLPKSLKDYVASSAFTTGAVRDRAARVVRAKPYVSQKKR